MDETMSAMFREIKRHLESVEGLMRSILAQLGVNDTPSPEETDTGELGTWLLTDEQVERVERAILEEQRTRGKAYGGTE